MVESSVESSPNVLEGATPTHCAKWDIKNGLCLDEPTSTPINDPSETTTDDPNETWDLDPFEASINISTSELPENPGAFQPTPSQYVGTSTGDNSNFTTPSSTVTEISTSPVATDVIATSTIAPVGSEASPSSSSSSNNGSNLSSGAVAGIAIATLIVGAALAFLFAFFFFKRQTRKREANGAARNYTNYADSTPELVMMQQQKSLGGLGGRHSPYVQVSQTPAPPPPAPAPAPAPAQQQVSDTLSFLPPAANENAIHARVTGLFRKLHEHVDMYYRDVHASITPSLEPELAEFGAVNVNMAELLQDCSSPTTALKHALVAYVVGITGPATSKWSWEKEGETLFPEELCGGLMGNVDDGDGEGDGDDDDEDTPPLPTSPSSPLSLAISLHRRLSVYIYITTKKSNYSLPSTIRTAAEHFSLTFFPWANPLSSDQDKDEDLAGLISEMLDTRIWLFGQPETWRFEWEGTGRRGVGVAPGLVVGKRRGDGERDRERWVVEGVVVGM